MKRWLPLLILLALVPPSFSETEQPPFEVPDPAVTENFRQIYFKADKLSLLTNLFTYTFDATNNLFCIDSPTFCVDALNNRIGVGTATPLYDFHVSNAQAAVTSLAIQNDSTAAGAGAKLFLGVGATTATGDPFITFQVGNGGEDWNEGIDTSDGRKFKISGGTDGDVALGTDDRLTITSAGNVGINTTSPASKLHISSGTLIVDGTGSSLSVGTTVLYATNGGVGVGTNNPSGAFQVVGGQANFSSGTVTAPGIGFTGDSNTGLRWISADSFSVVTGGQDTMTFANGSVNTSAERFRVPDGTTALPSYSFTNDPDTGIHDEANNTMYFSAGGAIVFVINPTDIVQGAGTIFNSNRIIPNADNTYKCGQSGSRYTEIWAVNGTIQTSAYKEKRDVKELVFDSDANTFNLMDVSTPAAPISISSGTPMVPRGVMFKWKDKAGKRDDRDFIGFLADDLPLEAHPKKDDGTYDMENVYSTSVNGILCATVRDLQRQVAFLQSEIRKLNGKMK